MKNALIISYAFPPLSIAGTFRPMKFAKYLPESDWNTTVITVKGRDDIPRDETLLDQLPRDINVVHTQAWGPSNLRIISETDFKKDNHLSDKNFFRKRYVRIKRDVSNFINNLVSIPDPLIYWVPSVISSALQIYSTQPFDIVFTTSPPHSIHFSGLYLAKRLNIPWVADFRDPWVDNVYFKNQKGYLRGLLEKWLEKIIVTKCTRVIANTDPNRQKLLQRYTPSIPETKFVTVTNGFDKQFINVVKPHCFDKFTICHTGVLYSALEPYFFFESLAQWFEKSEFKDELRNSFQIMFVGTGDSKIGSIIENLNLQECVQFIPRVSHEKAISYAKAADLLLVNLGFKSSNKADGWIPLKLYDYLGCNRPIMAVVPEDGAASKLIQDTNSGYVVSRPDHDAVFKILEKQYSIFKGMKGKQALHPNRELIDTYDVKNLTRNLANIFNNEMF